MLEQALYPLLGLRDVRIMFDVGALEIGICVQARAAVTGTGNVNHIQIVFVDQPVQMNIDEIEPRRGAPVPEQARLDVLPLGGSHINGLSDGQIWPTDR